MLIAAKYDVEISGSATVHRGAETLAEVLRHVKRARGRVSVVDTKASREIYFGEPRHVVSAIEMDLDR